MNEWNLLASFAVTQILRRTGFNVHNAVCQLTNVGLKSEILIIKEVEFLTPILKNFKEISGTEYENLIFWYFCKHGTVRFGNINIIIY